MTPHRRTAPAVTRGWHCGIPPQPAACRWRMPLGMGLLEDSMSHDRDVAPGRPLRDQPRPPTRRRSVTLPDDAWTWLERQHGTVSQALLRLVTQHREG